jgi:hypothetical protein
MMGGTQQKAPLHGLIEITDAQCCHHDHLLDAMLAGFASDVCALVIK